MAVGNICMYLCTYLKVSELNIILGTSLPSVGVLKYNSVFKGGIYHSSFYQRI